MSTRSTPHFKSSRKLLVRAIFMWPLLLSAALFCWIIVHPGSPDKLADGLYRFVGGSFGYLSAFLAFFLVQRYVEVSLQGHFLIIKKPYALFNRHQCIDLKALDQVTWRGQGTPNQAYLLFIRQRTAPLRVAFIPFSPKERIRFAQLLQEQAVKTRHF